MSETLYNKYRPADWSEIVGHRAAVKSLKRLIESRQSQCFILCGPSGTGKTTMARIAAKHAGAKGIGIQDVPAAIFTGVDAMRELQIMAQYKPFGGGARALIVDECHALSKQAWQSLLQITEEPPAHVFWFFCTTDVAKVPATIKTRGSMITLGELSEADIQKIVEHVAAEEHFKCSDAVVDLIVREARGSARLALNYLAKCADVSDRKEAATLLNTVLDSDAVLALCRFLAAPQGSWVKAMAIVEKLKDENPEGIRIQVVNYLAACARGAKSDNAARGFLGKIEEFAETWHDTDGKARLLLAIGHCLIE